jgi:hypothetical protein
MHNKIAVIVARTVSEFQGCRAVFAPECSGRTRLQLFSEERRSRARTYCWTDLCVIGPTSTVDAVIEIEQSGTPTPAKVCGKLVPVALSRFLAHNTGRPILLNPRIAFIQVINTGRVKPASKKIIQYRNMQEDLRRLLPIGRVAEYSLIAGTIADFADGADSMLQLVATLREILDEN